MSDKAVSINNISFSYEKKPIYKKFSLDISANELFFIMGVNGCGKTTLLKILCSFLSVDSGDVYIHGKRINEYDAKSLSKVVSYVPPRKKLTSIESLDLLPTKARVMCGITRPTQPTFPLIDTEAAVKNVEHTTTTNRFRL